MSRCFPFPPPRYSRNGACSEELIKSIKLQKERIESQYQKEEHEAKEQRKEERRKKEKRKERKESKEKEAKAAHPSNGKGKELKLRDVESYQLEKIKTEHGSGCLLKEDNEPNDRSAITEEHDQPFSSTEPCCLSDSTQTSNKRKRSVSPSSSDHGPAIKIRLPLSKHREHGELQQDYHSGSIESKGITKVLIQEKSRHQLQGQRNSKLGKTENQYLTSARSGPSTRLTDLGSARAGPSTGPTDFGSARAGPSTRPTNLGSARPGPSTRPTDLGSARGRPSTKPTDLGSAQARLSTKPADLAITRAGLSNQPIDFTTAKAGPSTIDIATSAGAGPSTKPIDRKYGRKASRYDSLFQNWNPCAHQLNGFESEDQDWWMSTSQQQEETESTKRVKSVKDTLGCSSSTLWLPCAQLLPEADIYALPYTVPF